MRISELHDREDYHAILKATLCRAFREWQGEEVSLSFDIGTDGQLWRTQALLSAYTADGPVCRRGRRFLADGFRHTPVSWRRLPQWLLGTALASSPGLRWAGKPAFRLLPGVKDASELVILPGNQRIRFFHFGADRSRVVLKEGFPRTAMEAELSVRGGGQTGPFPPILESDPASSWFEEAIVDGYNLARCPPWFSVGRLSARALQRLEAWSEPQRSVPPAGVYVDGLWSALSASLERLRMRTPLPCPPLEPLLDRAHDLGEIVVGPSHGDCQPGNILVDRRGREVTFVDWEFHGIRSQYFDRLVFVLRSRWLTQLERRALAFGRGGLRDPLLGGLPSDPTWRQATLSLFLLEELCWRLQTVESAPFSQPPSDLLALLGVIRAVISQ